MLRDFANEFGAAMNPPRALEHDYRDALDLLEWWWTGWVAG